MRLAAHADLPEWRTKARDLLAGCVAPHAATWLAPGDASVLENARHLDSASISANPDLPVKVPRAFLALAEQVIAHADPQRFALLYRMLWRISHGEPRLLEFLTDVDVERSRDMAQAVRRDAHKMKAFVRFREIGVGDEAAFVAWFEPDHFIVDYVAPFFMRRFAGMRWSILTPYRSAHWDLLSLGFGAGMHRSDAPPDDLMETWWRTYYASIFNPARLNVKAMQAEMPQKYWKHLPEASLITRLVLDAPALTSDMIAKPASVPRRRIPARAVERTGFSKPDTTLVQLGAAARACRDCGLWQPATQAVFGEGPSDARIVVIGEQPGDKEDLLGRPFLGPAGQLFDRALAVAGLERSSLYVTNAVKHFKFEPRGKFRLHKRADAKEQAACRKWLDAEIALVKPRIILCLGSMAANAVFGPQFRLLEERGKWRGIAENLRGIATVHPAYLLRLPPADRDRAYAEFVADLIMVRQSGEAR